MWNCHFGAVQLYCNRYSNDCFVYRRNSPSSLNGIKLPKNRIMKLFYFNSSKWELIAERKMPEYRITILLNALHTAAQFRYISIHFVVHWYRQFRKLLYFSSPIHRKWQQSKVDWTRIQAFHSDSSLKIDDIVKANLRAAQSSTTMKFIRSH